jgi:heme exporter protein C
MNRLFLFFHKTGSPPWFYNFSGKLIPWLWAIFLAMTAVAMYLVFFNVPPDYQQGETIRIMYIHVPSAWMSMMIYGLMAIMGIIALVWRIRIMEVLVISSAPVGAAFTIVALLTGSMWGRPMWGTYWVWDARLTSELVLLFLYFGVIALYNAYDARQPKLLHCCPSSAPLTCRSSTFRLNGGTPCTRAAALVATDPEFTQQCLCLCCSWQSLPSFIMVPIC